jgi:hypothetical protein
MDAFESLAHSNSYSNGSIPVTVLVDANNVRRSIWPNISEEELVRRCEAWAHTHGHDVVAIFDGRRSADDEIAERAGALRAAGRPFWLVTSDRGLRARAEEGAGRVLGGGAFVRELLAGDP